jgi:hypothetical protein
MVISGTTINYATSDPSWWLIALPIGLLYVAFEGLKQPPDNNAAKQAPAVISAGGVHWTKSHTLCRAATILVFGAIMAGIEVKFLYFMSSPASVDTKSATSKPMIPASSSSSSVPSRSPKLEATAATAPPSTLTTQPVPLSAPTLDMRISPASYDAGRSVFSDYGPYYVADKNLAEQGVTYAHAYGNKTGSLLYDVDLEDFSGNTAELDARLSADEVGFQGSPNGYSDVTLVVNGTTLSARRVTPDDGKGALYQWLFSAKLLHPGANIIGFQVDPTGQFPNGVCVYGQSLIAGVPNASITLRTN